MQANESTISSELDNKLEGVSRGVNEIRSQQRDQEHQATLEWLSPIDYALQQRDYISKRQPETGQWFLDSQQFKTWLNAGKQTLFCPGYPGAGKTLLTSIVVQYLQTADWHTDCGQSSSIRGDKIGIAYIYCDFTNRDGQKPPNILASLIRQLIEQLPSVPQEVEDLYKKYRKIQPSSRLSADTPHFSEALRLVISRNYARVFIIIDALDECQDATDLLPEFSKLQGYTRANILATSRPEKHIEAAFEKAFGGSLRLGISARDEDVAKYIDGRISELDLVTDDLEEDLKTELKMKIKDKVIEAVDGV